MPPVSRNSRVRKKKIILNFFDEKTFFLFFLIAWNEKPKKSSFEIALSLQQTVKSGQLNLSLSLSLSHFFALVWAEKAAAAVVHLRLVFAN